jgi:hypothetical protein
MSVVLDNGRVRLELDGGRLVALGHAELGIQLVGEPRLAEGWRLLVELPGGITTVRSVEQGPATVEADTGGTAATLTWDRLDTADGPVAIRVRQRIELHGDTLTARLQVDDDAGLLVEEAYPLVIGGMANWAEQDDWKMLVPGLIFGGEEWDYYREFRGSYLGYRRSTFAFAYPGASVDYWQKNLSMPWASLYHPSRRVGVYVANHNPEIEFSALWGEIVPQPDFAAPKGRSHLLWPHPDRVSEDLPIGAALAWAFFPLLHEGSYTTPPVVVHFHRGTWREAARHYRVWFEEHVGRVTARRDGLAAHDAWQNTYLESPGGRIRFRFTDLPRIAADALDAGIDTVMIAGFHQGGLDTSYPLFAEPSRRLGTAEELAAGIAASRELGVRVLLWGNANQISVDAPGYEERYARFANLRPDGEPHLPLGFGFDRLLGFMGVVTPRMLSANTAHPEFRELLLEQWEALADLGADGVQIDKLICGEPFNLDFNPAVDGHPMSGSHRALVDVIREISERLHAREPEAWVALESAWDRVLPYGEVLYCRFFGQDHLPVTEVTFPEVKATCCVCGQFDHGLINKSIRYGHVIALEGDYLWGTSADVPAIVPYLREVLRLRRGLLQNLWWATIVEPSFARVQADPALRVGAFEAWDEQPDTGTRHSLVLHHYEPMPIDAVVGLEAPYRRAVVHRPFAEPVEHVAPFTVTVARDEVVVLLPLTG